MAKGEKVCPNCGVINKGVRTQKCTDCGYKFTFFKTNMGLKKIEDWRDLQSGDYIKVISGSGPYYICSKDTEVANSGERVSLGHFGRFKVISIDSEGIHAHQDGHCYIYMGEEKQSKKTGTFLSPHKIFKLNSKK
jgi:hypothetical protein